MSFLSAIHWNVNPELFELGPITVRWYGLLFAMAFLLGFKIMHGIYKREQKPLADLDRLLIHTIVGTLVGARLGHCFFYEPSLYLSDPIEIIKFWKGGLASHGGAIGIFVSLCLYVRKRPDPPLLWLLDRICIPVALAGFFIRMGNLFNSEIIGIQTDVPWGFVFHREDELVRHPTQLYESLAYFTIFVVLMSLYRARGARTRSGLLIGLFFLCVFTARSLVEFVKERLADYSSDLPLSVGQMLSLPLIVLGAVLVFRAVRGGAAGSEGRFES